MNYRKMAAVDFVKHNEMGLCQFKKPESVVKIVEELITPGMSAKELVRRVLHCENLEMSLSKLAEVYFCRSENEIREFGACVYEHRNNPKVRWTKTFGLVLGHKLVLEHLLKTAPLEELAIYVPKAPDEYWTRKVRFYLANGDYERTWDEILKALRNKNCPASVPVIVGLVNELFGVVSSDLVNLGPYRPVYNKTNVGELLLKMQSKNSATDMGAVKLLHQYFGGKKAERRNKRRIQKHEHYEYRLK